MQGQCGNFSRKPETANRKYVTPYVSVNLCIKLKAVVGGEKIKC